MLRGLLAALATATSIAAPHHASADAFTKLDTFVPMSDGVKIAATYYEPTGTRPSGGWPAVMMFHGLGQTRNSLDLSTWSANTIAETYLAPAGYAVLTFDARAHGQSDGLFSLDGPRELQDTRELFDWLVARRTVDPQRIGAFGVSYGGGMVWLAATSGVKFAAIATAATWTDLHEALIPQGLIRAGVVAGFSLDVPPSRYAPGLADVLRAATSEQDTPAIKSFLAERSTRMKLSTFTTPTLMLQGRRDFAFDADQAIAAFRLLKGPKRLYLGDLGHQPAPNPVAEVRRLAQETRDWFDRFLKGTGDVKSGKVLLAPNPWDAAKVMTYPGLPPTRTLRFSARTRSRLTATGKIVRTFARVGHVETFGTPVVHVAVSSRTGYRHLVAVLTAVAPSGAENLITDGGVELPKLGAKPRTVAIRLPDEITAIPAGSRFRVTLAATSTAQSLQNIVYLLPVGDSSTATIGRVTLTLPVLKRPISP